MGRGGLSDEMTFEPRLDYIEKEPQEGRAFPPEKSFPGRGNSKCKGPRAPFWEEHYQTTKVSDEHDLGEAQETLLHKEDFKKYLRTETHHSGLCPWLFA